MLNLYTKITPNLSGTHYYFTDFSKYLTKLSNKLLTQLDNSRYDINKGFIRVKLGTDVTASNYKDVTYIINTTDNVCYHVSSQVVQSGYVIYNVNTDLWGTYIKDAKLNNILVKKCNRKISDYGTFDEITNTTDIDFEPLGNQYRIEDLCFVIVLKETISDKDFIETFRVTASQLSNVNDIASTIGRIKKIIYKDSSETQYNCSVESVYIMPIAYTITRRPTAFTYILNADNIRLNADKLSCSIFSVDLSSRANINYKYAIGSASEYLILPTLTNEYIKAKVTFVINANEGVKVVLSDGFNQKDITGSYTIPYLNFNEQNETLAGISRAIGFMTSFIQTGLGIYKGSPLTTARGLGGIGRSIVAELESRQPKQPNANILRGNGVTNFINNTDEPTFSGYIFRLWHALSNDNEKKKARKTGAIFNEYVDNLSNVFLNDLLGTGSNDDDTFIIASLDANDIPTNAVTLIESRFTSGVYLQQLQ